jgi:hypothetical protein
MEIVKTDDTMLPDNVELVNGTGFTFKRLKERRPGEAWTLLVYGQSKSGKTHLVGTAGSRVLYINIGNGIETLLAPAFRERYGKVAEEMITVDISTDDMNGFDKVCVVIDHALKHFPGAFDWVIVDEATALRREAMNKSMELNTKERSKIRDNPKDEFVAPDVQDFLREMQAIEWFLATYIPIFKREGKHFVMVAHERQIYKKAEKAMSDPVLDRIVPGFTGKTFPDAVPAYFDDVWHMEKVDALPNPVYRVRTAGTGTELGDSRHGGIFKTQENDPNLQEMLQRIKKAQLLVAKKR